MKILVLDDHPLIQDALSQLLPQFGEEIVVRGAIDAPSATRILDNEPDGDDVRIAAGALGGLTARQADVLLLMIQGKPNKLICRDLRLSEGTVKVHVSAILKALKCHTRTEAVAMLAQRGISVETLAARR